MDFASLAPQLARAGAPLIADLLTTAAGVTLGPAGGAVVGLITHKVAEALGADPSPGGIAAAIDANPDHAAAALPQVEADHADLIQGAIQQADAEVERARIEEQGIENAREMEIKLASTNTLSARILALAPLAVTAFNFGMFAWVTWYFMSGHNIDNPNGNLIVGAIIGAYAASQQFYTGGNARGSQRTDQLVDLAHKAAPPATATKARR